MSKTKILVAAGALMTLTPVFASAQGGSNLLNLLGLVQTIVGKLIPIMVAVALIYFIWGLLQFILTAGGEEHEAGKKKMWWGIIALFVIVSIWGIVAYIGNIFGITQGGSVSVPTVPGLGG